MEDFGHITLTFSDGTKAKLYQIQIYGGIQNHINLITNDGVLECLMIAQIHEVSL